MAAADLEIRTYADGDEAAVVSLWHEALPESVERNDPRADIRRKSDLGDDLFLVGVAGDRVVATAMAGYDGHRGWVYYLAVAADCRELGYGRGLMLEAARRLRARGCPKINLQVRRSTPEAVAFYERLGYEVQDLVSMGYRLE